MERRWGEGLLNGFYYAAGLLFLQMAKSKSALRGYADPKPFTMQQLDRCVDYDLALVDRWLAELERYLGPGAGVEGKSVLEIGPGSDLGAGLYLLACGAACYRAVDKFRLAASAPQSFYARLFERLRAQVPHCDLESLRRAVGDVPGAVDGRLQYVVRSDFNIAAAVPERSVDVVFSNAAFEHLDDVENTLHQISRTVRPGGVLVSEVDLRTHSRWIRDKDPNNIYRYSDRTYRRFRFPGIPNRVRPQQYRECLEANGWGRIEIRPASMLATELLPRNAYLADSFRDMHNKMEYLTVILCATKLTSAPAPASVSAAGPGARSAAQ
jgi:SAM-dependent methyltransferase